jgi:hypothetical protein
VSTGNSSFLATGDAVVMGQPHALSSTVATASSGACMRDKKGSRMLLALEEFAINCESRIRQRCKSSNPR